MQHTAVRQTAARGRLGQLGRRLRSALPRGRTLPEAAWERRHRVLVWLLWACAAAVALYGLARGYGPAHLAAHSSALAALATLAVYGGSRRFKSSMASLGLLTASALAVHVSGGLIEMHFAFFVTVVVLTLYEDWPPFLLAVGYVLLHHGVLGALDPQAVYNHPDAIAHPWRWATIHGAFVLAGGLAGIGFWRLTEEVRAESERTYRRARDSEERFRRSFDDAPIGMVLLSGTGRLLKVNRSFCRITGYAEEELLGMDLQSITHPDDLPAELENIRRALAGEISSFRGEKRYRHAEGHVIWASLRASLIRPADDRAPYLIGQIEDISARRRAEEQARRRTAQQATVVELGQLALSGLELSELCQEAVQAVAASLDTPFARLMEIAPGGGEVRQIAAVGWPERIVLAASDSGSQPWFTLKSMRPIVVEDTATETRFDPSALREQGIVSGVSVVVADPGGQRMGVLSTHSTEKRDFSTDDVNFLQSVGNVLAGAMQRRRAELELRHQSLHDPLTGLPNRVLLLDRLAHALARSERTGDTLAVLFLDLDEFKVINDSLGHHVGDLLLAELAGRLKATLRGNDTLARFGGDEFVVLCEDLPDAGQAISIAERLRGALGRSFRLGTHEHFLTASIGVAVANSSYRGRPEALMRDADAAMYRAKAAGRDRYEIFDEVMRARIVNRLRTEDELRRALEQDELTLVYQPIVALDGGRSFRCEALVRWRHPERGLVPPGDFIPIAEESGLIVPIGGWVLEEACRQLVEWEQTAAPGTGLARMRVAVNLSAHQVTQPDIVDVVRAALERAALGPDRLVLEITESALIRNPEQAAATLRALDELGVRISLDDFGTGYSSLTSIKQYPLSAIKLDRSFVADLEPGNRDAAIVRSLVGMARSLSLATVAEGIETPEQLALLREFGCELGQGYLFSPPVPPDELARLVADGASLAGARAG